MDNKTNKRNIIKITCTLTPSVTQQTINISKGIRVTRAPHGQTVILTPHHTSIVILMTYNRYLNDSVIRKQPA